MATTHELQFEMFPERRLRVAYFTHVRNAEALREALVADELPPCTILSDDAIAGLGHIHFAANAALIHEQQGCLKTSALHSEVLYFLSPTTSIRDAYRRFGVAKDSEAVFIAAFDLDAEAWDGLLGRVEGVPADAAAVAETLQGDGGAKKAARLRKVFKISGEELECGSLLDAVVTRVAVKHAL